jgi:hypothetical protein
VRDPVGDSAVDQTQPLTTYELREENDEIQVRV